MLGAVIAGFALYGVSTKAVDGLGALLDKGGDHGEEREEEGDGDKGDETQQHRSVPLGGEGGSDVAGGGDGDGTSADLSLGDGGGGNVAGAAALAAAAPVAAALAPAGRGGAPLFTWKDVRYCVRSGSKGGKKGARKMILHGVSGEARAGEITVRRVYVEVCGSMVYICTIDGRPTG